jgi:hypothetical protein
MMCYLRQDSLGAIVLHRTTVSGVLLTPPSEIPNDHWTTTQYENNIAVLEQKQMKWAVVGRKTAQPPHPSQNMDA